LIELGSFSTGIAKYIVSFERGVLMGDWLRTIAAGGYGSGSRTDSTK
jgi:hypothetical protein